MMNLIFAVSVPTFFICGFLFVVTLMASNKNKESSATEAFFGMGNLAAAIISAAVAIGILAYRFISFFGG
jgi:hypothetical protein